MPQLSRPARQVATLAAALSVAPAFVFSAVVGAAVHSHAAQHSATTTVRTEKSSKYGTILVSSAGRTLYLLTADSTDKSVCTSSCTGIWPPLTTKGKPKAGKGVKRGLLGTIDRGNGVRQVTYDGHPLYMYAGDTGAGQVNGEGIASFGGTWYVLNKKGTPVTVALASASSGSSASGGGW